LKPVLVIDTETHLFSPGNMAPKIVCASYAFGDQSGLLVTPGQIENLFRDALTEAKNGTLLIVGHYVAYDMACVCANFPALLPLVFEAYDADGITDTANRERLLDIAEGTFRIAVSADGDTTKTEYSLADCVKYKFGEHLEKENTWRLRYAELDGVPLDQWPEEAKSYAIKDATSCYRLYLAQEENKRRLNYYTPTEFEESRADFALKLMTNHGIITDQPRVLSFWNETVERMDVLADQLVGCGLARLNKKGKQTTLFKIDTVETDRAELPEISQDLKRTRQLVKDTFPGDPPLTPKGSISTAAEVLNRCRSKDLRALVEYKGHEKNTSTFLSKLFRPLVHADFRGIGAASDRTSCSKPNLQQLPRAPGFRECFVPRPGNVFCACDFDTQEMRTLAQSCLDICGRSKLAERYQADAWFDPHLEFAAGLLGLDVAAAKARKEVGDKEVKNMRQAAKAANFGYPGGLGPNGFVKYACNSWGLKMSELRAKELKDAWMHQWPEMFTYFEHVRNIVGWKRESLGTIQIPQSGFVRGAVKYTDACNSYFQTLAAHCSKRALWEVTKRCFVEETSALYGSRPVWFVHDEVGLEVPEERGWLAAIEMPVIMVEAMNVYTPQVPSNASAVLMERWSKAAEAVKDEKGRLVPWREKTNC